MQSLSCNISWCCFVKKPNQRLPKELEDDLRYEIASLGFDFMQEFGFDERPAMELAYAAVELQYMNKILELMQRKLHHG